MGASGKRRRARADIAIVCAFALVVLVAGLRASGSPAAPAATTCNLVPQLRDVTINQGLGTYSLLVNGKETLVRLYLSKPSCAGSSASIQVTGGTLTVKNGAATLGTVGAPTPVPVSPAFPEIATYSVAPVADSTGDPKFVVPGSVVTQSAAFTGTFTATVTYQQRASKTATYAPGSVTFTTRPGTTSPITAAFDKPSNALSVLVVPMGDGTKTYSTQWTSGAQQALQDGMTAAVAREYPLPAGIGNLGGAGGLRYAVAPTLIDLKRLNLLDANGKFCGNGANYDAIKAQLAQFRLSYNTANPGAQATRVVGVVDPSIALVPPAACFEAMAALNSQEAWAVAETGKAGQLVGLELAHTFGLVPPNRESPFDGAHSQNITAENPSANRRFNIVQRSFITSDRSLMKPTATNPTPDNVDTLFEVPDFAFALCILGGTVFPECQTYGQPGSVNAGAPVGSTIAIVMSGSTDGSAGICSTCTGSATGTSVVESYFASSVPLTTPSSTSDYHLVQRNANGAVLSNLGVPVGTATSEHGDASHGPHSGLFSLALPFQTTTDRIELWKGQPGASGSLLLYAQSKSAPPQITGLSVGNVIPLLHARMHRSNRLLATFTVTTTADSGAGSLRQAITDANNASGADTIDFSIGTGHQVIQPLSALPPITDPVTIDATTQPGYSGAPLIELDGESAGASHGIVVATDDSVVRGLIVNRFQQSGVVLQGARNRLESSYVGTNAAGTAALANDTGVTLGGNDNVLGGSSSTRNVVSGNSFIGVRVTNGTGNVITGNYIGLNAPGTAGLGNCYAGIDVDGANDSIIGGTTAAARNVVAGNGGCASQAQIELRDATTGNRIQGNYIGTAADGTTVIAGATGIEVGRAYNDLTRPGPSDTLIGGTAAGAGNIIAGQGGAIVIEAEGTGTTRIQGNYIGTNASLASLGGGSGITIFRSSSNTIGGTAAGAGNTISNLTNTAIYVYSGGTKNEIRGNAISGNSGLGIDLLPTGDSPAGVTPNDPGDADTGGNDLQNFPVLGAVTTTQVDGSLDSAATTVYSLDFFDNASCDPSGNGEGQTFLGSQDVTTDGSGNASFTFTYPSAVASGHSITATATDPNGNTSEFSACATIGGGGGGAQPGPDYTVNTNTDPASPIDSGCTDTECTLREAIEAANADPADNSIEFNLPGSTQIALGSPLPAISDKVAILGATQPAGRVSVHGTASVPEGTPGLLLDSGSSGSEIDSLAIDNFSGGAGIEVVSAGDTLSRNLISAVDTGISVHGGDASGNLIGGPRSDGGNRIWGFAAYGIRLNGAGTGNRVEGNVVGLDGGGLPQGGPIGLSVEGTNATVVGSDVGPSDLVLVDYELGNIIVKSPDADNGAILITGGATGTVVAGNYIGTDPDGTDLGNFNAGIKISSADGNQIGPGNYIAYNGGPTRGGVSVASGVRNRIVADFIHDNGGKGIVLGAGANDDLGAPSLGSATVSGGTTTVHGSLSGVLPGSYFVELFKNGGCDPSGFGEGEAYLDFVSVTVSGGSATFSKDLGGLVDGDVVTATLTGDGVRTDDTSEFSNCVTVQPAQSLPPGQEPWSATATDDHAADLRLDGFLVCPGQPTQVIFVGLRPDSTSGTTASWSGAIDTSLAPPNCNVKVAATDGFTRTPITDAGVPQTADPGGNPVVAAVSSPRAGATILQYGLIPLRGSIFNSQGVLGTGAHEWSLTGPGGLTRSGTGPIVDLQPPTGGWPAGSYTATLRKAGSTNAADSDSVTFTVVTDADNDGIPATVESSSCFGTGGDSDPLNAYADQDSDGIPNVDDPQPCTPASSYRATVDVNPDPMPTGSSGNPITAYVRVPGRDVSQVLGSTVRITRIADSDVSTNNNFKATSWTVSNGVGTAKFDRQKVVQYLASKNIHNRQISITVAGSSGAPSWSFSGFDTVFVQG